MEFFLFVVYAVLATVAAVLMFAWALRTGQFKDQQRARYLPLSEAERETARQGEPPESPRMRLLKGLVGMLIAFGLAVSIVVAYAALF